MLLYERGEQLTGHQSAVTEALACWTEALALIDPAENPALAASLRDRIAHAYRALGRHADAEREMTAVAETIAAKDPEGAKLHLASFQAAELLAVGHPGQVIALLEPLIPVMERSAPETEVWDRLQLGKAYAHQQRYTQAVRQLLRCRRLCREYGVRRHEPEVLLELGIAYRGRGWQGRAREVWEEGLPKAETMANNEKAAVLAYELADDHQRQRDNRGAAELFARSAQAFEAASQHCNRANALDRLARVRLGMGDRDGAADAWARAIAGLDHADDQAEAEQIRRFLRKARAALLG